MEGGDLWNMFKTANRKVIKNVAPALFGSVGTIAPLVIGQPELIPPALAVAGVANELTKASLPIYGKNKKRYEKLNRQQEEDRQFKQQVEMAKAQASKPTYYNSPYQTAQPPPNNISSNTNMPYRRTYSSHSTGSGLHAPRSRGGGYDITSPLARASLGHSQANAMLGKMEGHLASARQATQGLMTGKGTLINQIAPLQSQPQQNFQFRHTLITPAFHPTVFGN